MTLKQKLYTVWAFFIVNIKRLFRDRLALFFTFLFPLIFLFVFGGLNSHNNDVSFSVAIINRSNAPFAKQFVSQINKEKVFDVDKTVTTFAAANEKMSRGELDATIELPQSFGQEALLLDQGAAATTTPSGQAIVHYTQNNQSAAVTLTSLLQAQLQKISATEQAQILANRGVSLPSADSFTAVSKQNNEHSLSSFDYTVTGLLGFSILGAGIFGPINVFPELKKMGILRRLHTTPLRVWQYFLSVMLGNAVSGLMSLAVMLIVAVAVFHLKLAGNYFELGIFLAFSIIMILGIGLAVGGWAKNERQAAPLANIIVFPMMFLSGTFFPRFLMPHWLQTVTNFLPLTPVIDGARLIATEGDHLTQLGPQLGMMGLWLVVVYTIAFRVFRWE